MASHTIDFRSGDALVGFDEELTIVFWNDAAARLTGLPACEALGRPCWEVLGGQDGGGGVACHAGCSVARLAREGWPVPTRHLTVRTGKGRQRVAVSTIAARNGEAVVLHLLRVENGEPEPAAPEPEPAGALTRRQLEVLRLLADGEPAKAIARRLEISETTVRNHIRAILLELGCHSQLEAVARARRTGLL